MNAQKARATLKAAKQVSDDVHKALRVLDHEYKLMRDSGSLADLGVLTEITLKLTKAHDACHVASKPSLKVVLGLNPSNLWAFSILARLCFTSPARASA